MHRRKVDRSLQVRRVAAWAQLTSLAGVEGARGALEREPAPVSRSVVLKRERVSSMWELYELLGREVESTWWDWVEMWGAVHGSLRAHWRMVHGEQLALEGEVLRVRAGMTMREIEAWAAARQVSYWLDVEALTFCRKVARVPAWSFSNLKGLRVGDAIVESPIWDAAGYEPDPRALEGMIESLDRVTDSATHSTREVGSRVSGMPRARRPSIAKLQDRVLDAIADSREVISGRPARAVNSPRVRLEPDELRAHYTEAVLPLCGWGMDVPRVIVGFDGDEVSCRCDCPRRSARPCAVKLEALLSTCEHLGSRHAGRREELLDALEARLSMPDHERWLSRIDEAIGAPELPAELSGEPTWFGWRVLGTPRHGLTVEPAIVRAKKRGGGVVTKRFSHFDHRALMDELDEPRDRDALRLWSVISRGKNMVAYGDLLEVLAGRDNVYHFDTSARPLKVTRVQARLELEQRDDRVRPVLKLGDATLGREDALITYRELRQSSTIYRMNESKTELEIIRAPARAMRALRAWLEAPEPRLGPEAVEAVVTRAPRLVGAGVVSLGEGLRGKRLKPAERAHVMLSLDEAGLDVSVRVRPLQRGVVAIPGEGAQTLYGLVDGAPVHVERRFERELEEAARIATTLSLPADEQSATWRWSVQPMESALDMVARVREHAEEGDLEVAWDSGAPIFAGSAGASSLSVSLGDSDRYFKAGGELRVEGQGSVTLAGLLEAARDGRRWVQLDAGGWVRLEERLSRALTRVGAASARGGLGTLAAPALLALAEQGAKVEGSPKWLDLTDRIDEATTLEPDLPAGLNAQMRPYQKDGYTWLARLAHWAPGAILADDMGLGKTLQALTLLLHREKQGPALVVAPTSLGANWAREAASFAPGLELTVIRGGAQLERMEDPKAGQVWVMSYDLCALHAERLAEIEWSTHVLDEAQAIKNPQTRRAQATRAIGADFKVALTGTPVENRAAELWSICATVAPGLLGSRGAFDKRFSNAIERGIPTRQHAARASLAATVAPFTLRRTKREVATELPARLDVRVDVDLSPEARVLYDELRRVSLAALNGDSEETMQMLAALTRLRQIACHPALLDPSTTARSTKLDVLRERVLELKSDGGRCLIFSQFTSLLDLAGRALDDAGVTTVRLDGSMNAAARERSVNAFQAGEADAFLLSIKAGGTGLNLTAATSVFILDPWWNPAVEDQAADRAHRIGQTEPVTVYRLVARDTIEDVIYSMHADKRELAASVLSGAGSTRPVGFEELRDLLAAEPTTLEAEIIELREHRDALAAEFDERDLERLSAELELGLQLAVDSGELQPATAKNYTRFAQNALGWVLRQGLDLDTHLVAYAPDLQDAIACGDWDAPASYGYYARAALAWIPRALSLVEADEARRV